MALFDFLKDASTEKKAAGQVFGFLGHAAKSVASGTGKVATIPVNEGRRAVATVTNNAPAEQSANNQANAGIKVITQKPIQARDIAVGTARQIARIPETVVRTGIQAGEDITAKATGVPQISASQPTENTGLKELVYGKQPLETYQKRAEGVQKQTKLAAPFAFLGIAGGDLFGGPGKAAGKQVAESGIEQLAKATTEKEVRKIMEGTPQAVVDKTAHAIAQTKDPHIVDNIIQKAYNPAPEIAAPLRPIDTGVAPPTIPQDIRTPDISAPVQAPHPDPFSSISDAINGKPAALGQSPVKGVSAVSRENAALISAQRGERFNAAQESSKGLSGSEAYYKDLAAQTGKYKTAEFHPLIENIGPEQAESMFSGIREAVKNTPDNFFNDLGYHPEGARLTVQHATRQILGLDPGIPGQKAIDLVKQFSPQLAEDIKTNIPAWEKAKGIGRKIMSSPKALLSSFDISGMGRQGAVLGARFPVEYKNAFADQVKLLGNKEKYKTAMRDVANRENHINGLDDKAGLALTGVHEFGHTEEAFPSSYAEKIPGVGASNRAYTGALTNDRAAVFDHIVQNLQDAGFKTNQKNVLGLKVGGTKTNDISQLTDKQWKDIGKYINTFSGRGELGPHLEKYAQALGDGLFSPRLWKSRLDMLNPIYYAKLDGPAQKLALQNAGSFAGLASAVLGLAIAAGASVETDARSSDFLKIKVGDTRVDIFGGLQQNLVFAWREISGETKSSTTGAVHTLGKEYGGKSRLTILSDLIANKEAPLPAEASRIISGKDRAGNPITPQGEAANLLIPLSPQETISEVQHYGIKGAASSLPGYLGAGEQTYGVRDIKVSPKQKAYLDKVKDPEQKKAYTSFLQTQKVAQGTKKNVAAEVKAAVVAGDINKAVKIAKAYNATYSQGFKDWSKQNSKYRTDQALINTYSKGMITDETLTRYIDDAKKGN